MKSILILLLAANAAAIDYPCNKKMDTWEMHKQILAAGLTLDSVGCTEDARCTIYNASQDPASVCSAYSLVTIDRQIQTAANRKAAILLLNQICSPFPTAVPTTNLLCRLGFMLIAQ